MMGVKVYGKLTEQLVQKYRVRRHGGHIPSQSFGVFPAIPNHTVFSYRRKLWEIGRTSRAHFLILEALTTTCQRRPLLVDHQGFPNWRNPSSRGVVSTICVLGDVDRSGLGQVHYLHWRHPVLVFGAENLR